MKEKYLDYTNIKPDMNSEEITEIILKNYETLHKLYPEEIPNEECKHAIISGFLMNIEDFKMENNICKLLETNTEEIFLWKNGKHNIQFVSKVKENAKLDESWKTFGYLFELSFAYCMHFEHTADEVNYNWVYRFDPKLTIDEQDIYNYYSTYTICSGHLITINQLMKIVRIVFFLDNNNSFLHSLINFHNSMETSYTCLICELSESDFKMHSSHEPKIWEKLSMINNYGVAVILAYKSAELILGNPPNKENNRSLNRFLERWENSVYINPEEIFSKSKISYFDYFYEFKQLRNSSAHANFGGTFEMKRKQSIEAQCFAAEILFSYAEKNIHTLKEIISRYNLNDEIFRNS